MQSSSLITVVMPISLGIIMFGLGLSLTVDDFKRIAKFPRPVAVGLFCQMGLLPFVCFGLVKLFHLPPELGVGMMLLAASPGGAVANLYSHLAKGDVALNVTLTATNSVLSLFTLPLIVNLSLLLLMGEDLYIPIQFKKVVEVFMIVLGPVSIGMVVKHVASSFADRMEKPVKIVSAIILALIIIGAIIKEKANIPTYFAQVGIAALSFNILSMATGYFVPKLFGVKEKQAIAIGMEIGIHNGTLAIFIALNVLSSTAMAVPAAIYSIMMFFTAAAFGYLVNFKKSH